MVDWMKMKIKIVKRKILIFSTKIILLSGKTNNKLSLITN